jgi:hypothetical protein
MKNKPFYVLIIFMASAISAGATSGILLVSDQTDGVSDPQNFDDYYRDALEDEDNNYDYTFWDHDTLGEPEFADLAPYRIIMWVTGGSGELPASDPLGGSITLTPDEQSTLVQYLYNAPGDRALVIFGLYAAWNCVADAENEEQMYNQLFSDYFRLSYPDDNFDNWIEVGDEWTVRGKGDCPIFEGNTYDVEWRHWKNFPDQLDVTGGGSRCAEWVDDDNNTHHYCAIRASGSKPGGTYRTVLFSLPLECVEEYGDRVTIMHNVVEWCGIETSAVEPASVGRIKTVFK